MCVARTTRLPPSPCLRRCPRLCGQAEGACGRRERGGRKKSDRRVWKGQLNREKRSTFQNQTLSCWLLCPPPDAPLARALAARGEVGTGGRWHTPDVMHWAGRRHAPRLGKRSFWIQCHVGTIPLKKIENTNTTRPWGEQRRRGRERQPSLTWAHAALCVLVLYLGDVSVFLALTSSTRGLRCSYRRGSWCVCRKERDEAFEEGGGRYQSIPDSKKRRN